MADYLASLDVKEVAAFYRRLALSIRAKVGSDSLAAILLLHWLDGNGADKVYPAKYVRSLDEVRSYLRKARLIFLSQTNTPSGGIGGVIPRIRGTIRCTPADGPYKMHLEGNVETPLSVEAKAKLGMKVEPTELDALFALHGFTVISDVVVSAKRVAPRGGNYILNFDSWVCKASDEYHWNPDKHLEVPNPDCGSKEKTAVAPGETSIVVYHRNAIRVEKAGLAKAFHDESEPWTETDLTVVGQSTARL